MRSMVVWAGLVAVAVACAPSLAEAQTVKYGALLTGSGEPQAVLTAAFGDFTLDIDVPSGRADFVLRLWNVPAAITDALCPRGTARETRMPVMP